MRKLLTFIVMLVAVMTAFDHLHLPSNTPLATKQDSVTTSQEAPISEPAVVVAAPVEPAVSPPIPPTPTPVSAAPNPPPTPPAKVVGGCEQYRALLSKYDWNVRVMMAVMQAESTSKGVPCNRLAVGDTKPIRGVLAPSCGLLQVRTVAAWRGTCDQLKDPAFNIAIAHKIYKGQGMSAWGAYTNGSYLKYLR